MLPTIMTDSTTIDSAALWLPTRLADLDKPRYLAIVEALEADIDAGKVAFGTRLPPQREMAARLGLSVATVAKACAEAQRRGLVSGEVGRGTFVAVGKEAPSKQPSQPASTPRLLNLTHNVAPETGEAPLVARAFAAVTSGSDFASLLHYLPHAGLPDHRAAVSGWLDEQGLEAPVDRIFLCNGAQHAISVALGIAARPGAVVLTEAATYAGIAALAEIQGYRLHGVALDREGILPDALDAAFTQTGAKVLYCMPTLQTPTCSTMSAERRADIARTLKAHDALVIEDDVYSFLGLERNAPLSSILPDRAFHVSSFAKCAGPGLRAGALVLPTWAIDRAKITMRASSWMANPVASAVAAHMIRSGAMAELVKRKRAAAESRSRVAARLSNVRPASKAVSAFHFWLPLASSVAGLIAAAAMRGVILAPPTIVAGEQAPTGLRLCLGGAETLTELEAAITIIGDILNGDGLHSLV
jgi:DNA-binding transcriptional MocR family regulator